MVLRAPLCRHRDQPAGYTSVRSVENLLKAWAASPPAHLVGAGGRGAVRHRRLADTVHDLLVENIGRLGTGNLLGLFQLGHLLRTCPRNLELFAAEVMPRMRKVELYDAARLPHSAWARAKGCHCSTTGVVVGSSRPVPRYGDTRASSRSTTWRTSPSPADVFDRLSVAQPVVVGLSSAPGWRRSSPFVPDDCAPSSSSPCRPLLEGRPSGHLRRKPTSWPDFFVDRSHPMAR